MDAPLRSELSAQDFAAALRSGIHKVIQDQDTLNAINVFPVADGDTGTNLSLSLGSGLGVLSDPAPQLGMFLATLADVLLDGSRGNSGAIVAQFFQGVSDAAEGLETFSTSTFARAVELGNEYAHDALARPREGTILSITGALAAALREAIGEPAGEHFAPVMTSALEACRRALENTRNQLEVLRKAGVVDAGAKGFVDLLDGMTDYIVSGREVEQPDLAHLFEDGFVTATAGEDEDLCYRYCTECLVSGEDIDRRKLREALSELGNSLVLAGTKRKAKIHIHVNDPDEVFVVAGRYGEVSAQKADDMHRQQHSTHHVTGRFAVITDSAADIAEEDMERLDIHMVPARVHFGERGYLDKVSITPDEFFHELATNPQHPTTSQPSAGDFRRQYQFLASHFPDVIAVSLTGRVSGTLQAAQAAAERTDASGKVHVVDTRNASVGEGLIAVFAAECAQAGLDTATTLVAIDEIIPQTTSFALIKDLRYGVRGGRVPASVKLVADLFRLSPVLRTTADGRVAAVAMLPGRRNPLPRFARYVLRHSPRGVDLRIAIGHAQCRPDAEALEKLLRASMPNIIESRITALGSALGVHGGPGALVVGVQRFRRPAEFP
ncbi:MAG: DegV family EDD domain-containing protein [Gammaproteobacteria bacterium]|nr:DegV family EDD domain-containing protein [Gammaproteobacteria bacterium]